MTEKEMILDMFKRQEEYDQMVFKAHGIKGYDEIRPQIDYALFDELGELNHAMKSRWCWWKNTQKPEDREEVLGELADVVHFVLMRVLAYAYSWQPRKLETHAIRFVQCMHDYDEGYVPFVYEAYDFGYNGDEMETLAAVIKSLEMNLTVKDVYDLYCKKNDINRKRVQEGY